MLRDLRSSPLAAAATADGEGRLDVPAWTRTFVTPDPFDAGFEVMCPE